MGAGVPMELRLYQFSAFILLGLSGFLFLITLYSAAKMKDHPRVGEYYAYVFLSAALAFGAVLADNFVPLVFFWEGLLVTLYALISLGGKEAHRTATKAFIISGFCDFAMILGIGIVWSLTGDDDHLPGLPQARRSGRPGLRPDDDRGDRQGRGHALPHLDPGRRGRRPGDVHGLHARGLRKTPRASTCWSGSAWTSSRSSREAACPSS